MDSSYRPQSPDLSGYMPRSPDLTGLAAPVALDGYGQPLQHPQLQQHSRGSYGGPSLGPPLTTAFPGQQSIPPHLHQQHQQPQFLQPYPPQLHDPFGMPSAHLKQEDQDYYPTVPQSRSKRGRPPGSNGAQMMDAHAMKTENPDPTLGITLKTSFPVARIKRIMQADEDIGKVAQVTPHVVSRALELFMIQLITASANEAQGHSGGGGGGSKAQKRILSQHLKRVVNTNDSFDFLREIVGKVPDAPSKAKKEVGSDSEDAKPVKKRGKKRKDSGDDM